VESVNLRLPRRTETLGITVEGPRRARPGSVAAVSVVGLGVARFAARHALRREAPVDALDGEHDTICGIGPIAFPIRRCHTSIGYLV